MKNYSMKSKYYDWMKHRLKWHYIDSLLDIPILIFLWALGYTTAFWVVLGIMFLIEVAFANMLRKLAKLAGFKEW